MTNHTQQIVARAWNFAHVLRDVGLSYMAYTEQITFLLFLKMADELTRPPHNLPPRVPKGYDWSALVSKDGEDLERQYRHTLEELGKQSGMLGQVFLKARADIQNPALLRKLIDNLIQTETWTNLEADVKGDIYEGLLSKSAEESPKGAGQYFTPRPLIDRIVDCVRPTPDDTVADPACGTGGFLIAARPVRPQAPPEARPGPEEEVPHPVRHRLGDRAEHGPAVRDEPVSARRRRRPVPGPVGRRQSGEGGRRGSVFGGGDEPAVRQEVEHRVEQRQDRQRRRDREGRFDLRSARLHRGHEEQAARLRAARHSPAESRRPVCDRDTRQRVV